MDESLNDLSRMIFDALIYHDRQAFLRLRQDLEGVDFKNFLVHNFASSSSYIERLMFATQPYWQSFSLNDWIQIIERSSANELRIIHCLSFVYKYIGIDSLKLYENLNDVDNVIKNKTMTYFTSHRSVLGISRIDLPVLEEFGLDLSSFEPIKQNLIAQGATAAVKVIPKIVRLKDEGNETGE